MRTTQLYQLGETLMRQHGLTDWSFGFDNAKRRAGCCNYSRKRITLSRHIANNYDNTMQELKNTILHEIAHALVGHKHDHDEVWRAQAKAIGCTGDRCHTMATPESNKAIVCSSCHARHKVFRVSRVMRRATYRCPDCKTFSMKLVTR